MYKIYVDYIPKNSNALETVDNNRFKVPYFYENSITLILYKNTAEPHRVNKAGYLETVGEIGGVFRDSASYSSLQIDIEYDKLIDFNYIYLVEFDRYYYVSDVTTVNNKLWTLTLDIDVLYTYRNAIMNLDGFIDRNENTTNPLIVDKKIVTEMGEHIYTFSVDNSLFDGRGQYILNGFGILTPEVDTEGGE